MWPPFNYCCYDELMEQMQMKQNYVRRLNVRDVDNKINQYARSVFGKIGERKINHNTMSYPPCILIARCWFQRKGSWIVIRNFQGVKLCPLQETAHIKIESTAICRDVFAV